MEKQQLLPLEKQSDTYKMIIPEEVEKKIRFICNKIHQVEWSGTLFYTQSGSFEDNTLEIKCVDIYVMDIGSSTYTEFDQSPDIAAYMVNNPDLLDCQMGLIHSHNNMSTFFSGTDTNTLRSEGSVRNHFVSLIVNNEGTYTAAITRKLKIFNKVESAYEYKSFGDNNKKGNMFSEYEEEIIAYNYLTIVKEGIQELDFTEISDRLKHIKESKETKSKVYTPVYSDYSKTKYTPSYSTPKTSDVKNNNLFDFDYIDSNSISKYSFDNNVTGISKETVKKYALQLLTGSIAITNPNKIDPKNWASQMESVFSKRFPDDKDYSLWIDTMIEFIIMNEIPIEYENCDDVYMSTLSSEIHSFISKLPSNKYIKLILNSLLTWM